MTNAGQGEIDQRIGKAEGALCSINQTLQALLEQIEARQATDPKESVARSAKPAERQDAELKRVFKGAEEEEAQEGQISEADLPDLQGERNDPRPDHAEKLHEEYSKAAKRNRWPAPESFAPSPLPMRFDPKDRPIKGRKE